MAIGRAVVKAKERAGKLTIYVKMKGDTVLKEHAKTDAEGFLLLGVLSDLAKGRVKEVLIKPTAHFKSVSNRDKVQIVEG